MELVKTPSIFISSPNYNRSKRIPNPRRRSGSGAMKPPAVRLGVSGSYGRRNPLAVSAGGKSAVAEKPTVGEFKVFDGMPAPLGAVARDGGVNFAICSSGASSATLCLFSLSDLKENRVTELIPLDPLINKTGNIWHVFLEGEFEDMLYGYKFDGKFCSKDGHYFDDSRILLDPYAKAVIGRAEYGVPGPGGNCWPQMACMIPLPDHKNRVTELIPLDPLINKTGNIWHVFLEGEFEDMLYGYKFDGKFCSKDGHYFDDSRILLDPYAKAVIGRAEYGVPGPGGNCWPLMACMIPLPDHKFDWQGDLPLHYQQKDLIIYEMHVRGYTKHSSSKTDFPGTYLGAVDKLDHLKGLGVNCIELMPCQEFNELEYFSHDNALGENRLNFWGYSTVSYFSPMMRYSSAGITNCGHDTINEFKTFVREAHKQGIEVLLDVVFNHTAEGNENGPILSFRGVDNSIYYMVAPKGEFYNYSGCGNTFNCNHPIVRQFILDCLRYWVTEMHVDGFRFDLASIMTRGSSLWDAVNVYGIPIEGDTLTTGIPLSNPPLIDMISNDPVLHGIKLIAEAWDAGGLYQVGHFPHWSIWSEWNGQFRDNVRQFIKGTDGFSGAFAGSLCGSPNLYQEGGRKPWNSINFVCAHDGFTLADLVTYNNKNNLSNGEENNDGENHNLSWNCGEEGEFASITVRKLRKRQMRNFFLCLMISQGVPMIHMGDEYGHTKGGNNNSYCHDNFINYFRWDKKEESSSDLFRFCHLMTKFRQECESLGLEDFPTADRLQWHGHQPGAPDWSETSRFVAFSMIDSVKRELYIAFNTSHLPVTITVPDRPGYRWEPLVDTSKPAPYDFLTDDLPDRSTAIRQYANFLDSNLYSMLSYSSVILTLQPDDA